MKKTKHKFRFLSIITSLSMLTCMMPTQIFANEEDSMYADNSEYVEVMDTTAEMEEPIFTQLEEEVQPVEEETTPEVVEPVVVEEPQVEDEVVEEEKEEEESYPAFNQSKSFELGKVTVTITAPEGVLPEGTTADITELDYEDDVQDVLDAELVKAENGSVNAAMYDVVLYDKDGNVIQPNGEVTIHISGVEMDIPEEYEDLITYQAIRINDDETLTVLKNQIDMNQSVTEFNNDHFTAVGIAAVANIDAMEAALMADGEYVYRGYKADNKFSPGSAINFWVENENNSAETYVAYCYNMHLGRPDGTDDSLFRKGDTPATADEFYNSLASDSPNKLTPDELQLRVMNVLNAGYPYNNANLIDFARNELKISEDKLNDALRIATQYAIWHYTDGYYVNPNAANRAGQQARLIGALVDYAEAQNTLPAGLGLTIFYPQDTLKQKLLTTNKPEGTDVTKERITVSVNVSKRWSNPEVPHDEVTVKLKADGIETGETRKLNEANKWTASFTELESGKIYSVEEVAVPGYTSSVSGNADTGFIITNTYAPQGTSINLSAKKTLTGRDLADKEFSFKLTAVTEKAPMPESAEVRNDQAGNVSFGAIEYSKAGTYEYRITEKDEKLGGVTYDTTVHTAKVVVTDDGKGKLSATVTYDSGSTTAPEFNNTYSTEKVSATLQVKKTLTGRDLADKEFSFKLTAVTEKAPMPESAEAKNDQDGNVSFGSIEYTTPGTYEYKITEAEGNLGGVTYDTAEHTAKVVVTDKGDGTLSTEVTYDNGSTTAPIFANTYTAKGTDITLEATKSLEGKKLEAGMFEFTLSEGDKVLQTKKNDADGKVAFDKISYTKAGTYTYTVKETAGKAGGITYDGSVYTVVVEVTDDGQGQLVATTEIQKGTDVVKNIVFENKYETGTVSATLQAKKTLTGRDLANEEFSFKLTPVTEKAPMPESAEAKNDQAGNVSFGSIEYSKAGTYEYKISETKGNLGGVTYDTTVHTAKVVVTDKGDGTLSTEVTYDNGSTTAPIFANTYTAKGTDITLEASKSLEGKKLEAGMFEFTLSEGDKVLQTKKNDADGKVAFDKISYTKAGTYTYTVKETAGKAGGITYDGSVYTVVVEVTDDGQGQLVATTEIQKGTDVVKNIVFENKYETGTVSATLQAKKTLTGRDLANEEFSFKLTPVTEKAPMPESAEAKNDQDGNVSFGAIEYSKAGTYEYKITEKDEKLGGVTYDTTVHTATVVVTDKGDGTLSAEVTYDNGSTTAPEFKNTYETGDVSVDFVVKKSLKNGTLKDDDYTFELKAMNDAPMPKSNILNQLINLFAKDETVTVKNKADGSVSFGKITYTTVGTYEYEVREVIPGDAKGIIYDTTVYKVTVDVTDDGNGNLKAAVTINNAMTMEFENTEIHFNVNKTELGSGDEVEGAKIEVFDEEGNFVDSWTSKEGETHDFGSKLEAGKSYTLKETVAPEGYNYVSDIKFTVKEDGTIKAEMPSTTDEDGNVTYLVEDSKIHFNVNKTELGSGDEVEGAKIEVFDENGKVVDSWTSKKNETHDFGPNLEAGKSYKLKETVAPEGYNYVSEIDFTVKEDGTIDVEMPSTTDEDGNVTYLVEDSKIHFNVNKTELGSGDEVEGAKIEVVDENGEVVDSWTSKKDETHDFGPKLEAGKKYTLKETVAPEGYNYVSEIKFTVEKDGTIDVEMPSTTDEDGNVTYLVEDSKIHFNVNKTELGTGDEVEGAKIEVFDENGKVVDSWTSKKDETHDFGPKLEAGKKYTLKETVAPQGYNYVSNIEFTVNEDGTIDVEMPSTTDEDGNVTYLVEDSKIHFNVNKTELGSGDEVAGAKIEVFDEEGNFVDSWTSKEGETHDFGPKLEAGKSYTLKETVAPEGYNYVSDIEFTVEKDGTIKAEMPSTTDEDGNVTYLVEDSKIHFNVNKTELGSGDEVEGAKIEVVDENGKVVDSWTSKKNETHDFGSKLEAGKSYTLKETVAPQGYNYVSEIDFTVEKDGTIKADMPSTKDEDGNVTYLVEDSQIHFVVNKTDLETGEELDGSKISIINKEDGKVVDSWTSKVGETHDFGSKIDAGKTYILREEVAPDGYNYATDIEFTVEKDGTITHAMPRSIDKDGNVIHLVEDSKLHFIVNKTDVANGKELDGAKIEVVDEDGKVVDSWTSKKDETHDFGPKLEAGKKYTLKETVAPDGYSYVSNVEFTVDKDGKVTADMPTSEDEDGNVVYLVEDTITKVSISKVDIANGEELEGAQIQILDEDGNVVEEWTSTKEAHEVEGLTVGKKYTLRETVAPDGYSVTSDTTFVLDKEGKVDTKNTTTTTKNGVLFVEDKLTEVKISKVDIANGKELEGAQMQILDKDGKIVTKWVSTKEVHVVKGLKTGVPYTLREKVAPKGYDITSDTTFELNADGTINTEKTTTKVKDGILLVEDSRTPTKPGTPTGADNGMNLYGSLLTVSMAGAACMLALRKKEDEE